LNIFLTRRGTKVFTKDTRLREFFRRCLHREPPSGMREEAFSCLTLDPSPGGEGGFGLPGCLEKVLHL